MEMKQSSDLGQYKNLNPSEGVEQDTTLEISLGGASRAERFLGGVWRDRSSCLGCRPELWQQGSR